MYGPNAIFANKRATIIVFFINSYIVLDRLVLRNKGFPLCYENILQFGIPLSRTV